MANRKFTKSELFSAVSEQQGQLRPNFDAFSDVRDRHFDGLVEFFIVFFSRFSVSSQKTKIGKIVLRFKCSDKARVTDTNDLVSTVTQTAFSTVMHNITTEFNISTAT